MASVVVVGGSDAGISAALRAREVDPRVAITVAVADRYPNYSICGLPYFLSGEVPDWRQLAHRSVAEIEGQGITLLLDHAAQAIDPSGKVVTLRDGAGSVRELAYDRLVIATGAVPREPPIAGLRQDGVFLLHTMGDSFALQRRLAADPPRSAIMVGGGYLGLEMADALTLRGIAVTLLQRGPSVLNTVDTSLGERIVDELRRHGVEVVTGVAVEAIARAGSRLVVHGDSTAYGPADLVLVAAGVQPATEVARTAGVALGAHSAIRVTRTMETSLPDIYAAGDCVETWHRLLPHPTYLPLGTTAHKQGHVAGENTVGGRRQFAGSVGTQVVKVFDLAIARTGLLEAEARAAGFDPLTVETTAWDHKVYYPGARELRLRITGDRQSGRLLGAQLVGHWQSEVAKRIDIFATALYHAMTVDDLNALDLSYTPPVSSPWDPVQMGAQVWVRAWIETQA